MKKRLFVIIAVILLLGMINMPKAAFAETYDTNWLQGQLDSLAGNGTLTLPGDVVLQGAVEPADESETTSPTEPETPEKSDIPKTGDTSRLYLWIVVAVLAGAASIAARIARRRKKNKGEE